jgi:CRISPR-associated endonuclease/helicase Cas3
MKTTNKPQTLKPDRLLAKSYDRWRSSYSLVGHTADVVKAVTLLIEILGDQLTTQFDLGCNLDELEQTARLAAYLHDWGKANDHFQGVVRFDMRSQQPDVTPQRNSRQNAQLFRHEALSMLLAWEFRDWLQCAEGDFITAIAIAGSHHLKLGGRRNQANDEIGEIRQECGDASLMSYVHHRHFKGLLRFGIQNLGLPQTFPKGFRPDPLWTVQRIKDVQNEILDHFLDWEPHPVRTAVLKSLLIAGDTLASAISNRDDLNLDKWVRKVLKCTLTDDDLDRVIHARLGDYPPRPFQIQLGNIQHRVALVRAGCGTGKTVGAYYWAKRHAIGRKLFFCYPTMGTSTEGFLDYVQDEVQSVLIHSKASADLVLARTGEENEVSDGGTQNEAAIKLSSFEAWESQAIVCTVDTVLGLTQCHRRPMYCFPAIATAAFVFDEVHSYDDALFGALLRFLETVKAPVLLMSASFLPSQVKAIEQAVGEPVETIAGAPELEALPRYRFHFNEKPDWERVTAELAAGGKVLWVCNQVSTAVGIYEQAQQRSLNSLLYHSRFRYKDRKVRHRETVDAFKPERREPVLAIATQVAEMSLDLSATLLVSQIADPAALVQRLGRLNRKYCGHPLDAVFYPDALDGMPYTREQLDRGARLVRELDGNISQADLARWLENNSTDVQPKCNSVWLDGEWRTYPGSLREAGVTVTVLLEEDIPQLRQNPHLVSSYTVPILAKADRVRAWERFKNYPVAPSDEFGYSPVVGVMNLSKIKREVKL